MTDLEFDWWRLKAWFYHLWGVHTWVPREDWRVVEGNVEVTVIGYICWRCPATKGLDDDR